MGETRQVCTLLDVAEALQDLAVLPIGRNLPEAERTAQVFYAAVRGCSPQAVRAAARAIASSDQWYPVPARLREVARDLDYKARRQRIHAYAGRPGVACTICGAIPQLAVFQSVRKGADAEETAVRFAVQCDPAKHRPGDYLQQPAGGFVRWVHDPVPADPTLDLFPDA